MSTRSNTTRKLRLHSHAATLWLLPAEPGRRVVTTKPGECIRFRSSWVVRGGARCELTASIGGRAYRLLGYRIANASPRRFLIADSVGLGKTIETALVLRELASRGELTRALMVVPAASHDIRDFRARVLATDEPESPGMATLWVSGYHHATRNDSLCDWRSVTATDR